MQQVIVIGGGFAGLRIVRGLRRSPVRVLLVDRTNHHCFQPLLYQVATGSLSPGEIAPPLRWITRRQRNLQVHLGEVTALDLDGCTVHVEGLDGATTDLPFDHLVVAAGARHSYFGNDAWEQHAPGLKTIEDALEIRRRIFSAFERADVASTEAERRRLLTFVVVGGGPTGVELAGQVAEIARRTLRCEYRRFDPADARIVLVDAAPALLGAFSPRLQARARRALEDLGVEVCLDAPVTSIDANGVLARDLELPSGTVIWAAGVQGAPVGELVAAATGAELTRGGQVQVGADFTVGDRADVRVVGDLAATGLPGVAPVAMQQGAWVARSIDAHERRRARPRPFRYRDRGSMATIGRRRAVASIAGVHLHGTPAWLAWLFVHLMYVVGFANRVLVLIRWMSAYLAGGRGERALTGVHPGPPPRPGRPTQPAPARERLGR